VPRHAHYVRSRAATKRIDDGIALVLRRARAASPASTSSNCRRTAAPSCCNAWSPNAARVGARDARAGEFSERAFLNGKLDLAQAEAVADLIAAGDTRAARAARRALDGVFSQRVDALATELLHLRIHVEAAIDFADESLDTLGGAKCAKASHAPPTRSPRCSPKPNAAASCATDCTR
jgi:tRNA modification GTPase